MPAGAVVAVGLALQACGSDADHSANTAAPVLEQHLPARYVLVAVAAVVLGVLVGIRLLRQRLRRR